MEPTTTRLVPCDGCRACCERELLILHPEHGDDPADFECYRLPDGRYALRQTPTLACIYLGESGCSIWARRPATCREFDCRLFLEGDAAALFRAMSDPGTVAKVMPAALACAERTARRRQELKQARRGVIPGKRARRRRRKAR